MISPFPEHLSAYLESPCYTVAKDRVIDMRRLASHVGAAYVEPCRRACEIVRMQAA